MTNFYFGYLSLFSFSFLNIGTVSLLIFQKSAHIGFNIIHVAVVVDFTNVKQLRVIFSTRHASVQKAVNLILRVPFIFTSLNSLHQFMFLLVD